MYINCHTYFSLHYRTFSTKELVETAVDKGVTALALTNINSTKVVTVLIYFIAHKHVPTKNGETMYFGTFIDSQLDWVDTVHFPESAKRYPLGKSGFFKATGKVTLDFGVVSLEVMKMIPVSYRARQYAGLSLNPSPKEEGLDKDVIKQ